MYGLTSCAACFVSDGHEVRSTGRNVASSTVVQQGLSHPLRNSLAAAALRKCFILLWAVQSALLQLNRDAHQGCAGSPQVYREIGSLVLLFATVGANFHSSDVEDTCVELPHFLADIP